NQTLEVFQSRTVHTKIQPFLDDLRSKKRAFPEVPELDLPTLARTINRGFSEKDFLSGIVTIAGAPDGRLMACGQTFASTEALIEYLNEQPRAALRSGIFGNGRPEVWPQEPRESFESVTARLEDFCRAKNLDFFLHPYYRQLFGQPPWTTWRIC